MNLESFDLTKKESMKLERSLEVGKLLLKSERPIEIGKLNITRLMCELTWDKSCIINTVQYYAA